MPDFVLIYNSNFILCNDRARYVLSVILKKKENVVFKMLMLKRAKAQLI